MLALNRRRFWLYKVTVPIDSCAVCVCKQGSMQSLPGLSGLILTFLQIRRVYNLASKTVHY